MHDISPTPNGKLNDFLKSYRIGVKHELRMETILININYSPYVELQPMAKDNFPSMNHLLIKIV